MEEKTHAKGGHMLGGTALILGFLLLIGGLGYSFKLFDQHRKTLVINGVKYSESQVLPPGSAIYYSDWSPSENTPLRFATINHGGDWNLFTERVGGAYFRSENVKIQFDGRSEMPQVKIFERTGQERMYMTIFVVPTFGLPSPQRLVERRAEITVASPEVLQKYIFPATSYRALTAAIS